MELASSITTDVIGLPGILLGGRVQERSTVHRERLAQQTQQRAELRAVIVKLLSRLAAMRRLRNTRPVLREADASETEQDTAKTAVLEAGLGTSVQRLALRTILSSER